MRHNGHVYGSTLLFVNSEPGNTIHSKGLICSSIILEVACLHPRRRGPGGGGGGLQHEIPTCMCRGSENVPIMKDAYGHKNIPILKGSSAHFNPIL